MAALRLSIRVRPGASRTAVGGRYGEQLVVRVSAPAVDGRATEAALRALAEAFGVPRRDVRLVSGASSRSKVVDVHALDASAADVLARRLETLLS